jgi:hypothetical protein
VSILIEQLLIMRTLVPIHASTALLMLLAATPVRATVPVTRPVSVQAVESDSVTLVWHTVEPTDARVEFGPTLDYGRSAEAKLPAREHALTLHKLSPGQTYFYRVRGGGEILFEGPEYFFRTLPDKRATRCRFLAFGDSGKGSAAQFSLVPAMVAARPDFVVHTGDVIYPLGEAEDFEEKYFQPYRDLIRNTPVWLSLGNHDVMTENGQPYLDAFRLPRNDRDGSERYYSFTWGQVHFVVLDSNGSISADELAWLEADLARTTTLWKVAVFHHPAYSCGLHGSSDYPRNRFAPLFERYGVDLALNGHDHHYERSYPMVAEAIVDTTRTDYRNPGGVIYVVTGGGAGPRETSTHCDFTAVGIAATHFTQVDVDGPTLVLQAIDADGRVLDRITIDKSPDSASAAAADLLPNVPNPFNPETQVRYALHQPGPVRVAVYDLAGRLVRELVRAEQPIGSYQVPWNGRDQAGRAVASGVYVLRLEAGGPPIARKLLLAK